MVALRDWLVSVVAVSVLRAAADSLMPAGGVKKVGKLACTLCVLCVMLAPLAALRGMDLTQWLAGQSGELEQIRTELEQQAGQWQKTVIEENCAAYISDKAAELGVVCRVEVDCVSHTDGLWLPEAVRLWGTFDDVAQSRMSELLERQMGLDATQQSYYQTEEESP